MPASAENNGVIGVCRMSTGPSPPSPSCRWPSWNQRCSPSRAGHGIDVSQLGVPRRSRKRRLLFALRMTVASVVWYLRRQTMGGGARRIPRECSRMWRGEVQDEDGARASGPGRPNTGSLDVTPLDKALARPRLGQNPDFRPSGLSRNGVVAKPRSVTGV